MIVPKLVPPPQDDVSNPIASKAVESPAKGIPAWLAAVGLFLVILSLRLWTIGIFASDLPYWDQWDAEAKYLLTPYFDGTLSLEQLFAPHNEHRVFLTRVLNLGLTLVNGQWDARLECVVNSVIYSLLAVFAFNMLSSIVQGENRIGLLLAVCCVFGLPYAYQNVVHGFHSQQYFLTAAALISIPLLVDSKILSRSWWLGYAVALLGMFSMGSGFFAAASALAVLILQLIENRDHIRRRVGAILLTSVIVVIGVLIAHHVPGHDFLRAHTFSEFIRSVKEQMSFPILKKPTLSALFVYAPMLCFLSYCALKVLRRRSLRRTEHILLGLSIWVLLQIIATSIARGGTPGELRSRYLDNLGIGLLINFAILARVEFSQRIASAWALMIFGMLCYRTTEAIHTEMPRESALNPVFEYRVSEYLRTGDIGALKENEIPYLNGPLLAERLAPEGIRRVLPVSVQPENGVGPLSQVAKSMSDYGYLGLIPGLLLVMTAPLAFSRREQNS